MSRTCRPTATPASYDNGVEGAGEQGWSAALRICRQLPFFFPPISTPSSHVTGKLKRGQPRALTLRKAGHLRRGSLGVSPSALFAPDCKRQRWRPHPIDRDSAHMLEPITEQFAVQHPSAALGVWGSRDLPSFRAKSPGGYRSSTGAGGRLTTTMPGWCRSNHGTAADAVSRSPPEQSAGLSAWDTASVLASGTTSCAPGLPSRLCHAERIDRSRNRAAT